MQKNNIVETSPAFIKTDGIKSGTHVSIPANDPEMPFTGVVVKVSSINSIYPLVSDSRTL